MACFVHITVMLLFCMTVQVSEGIRYSELFPHGADAGDMVLDKGDNIVVTARLRWPMPIFGTERNEITVSSET